MKLLTFVTRLKEALMGDAFRKTLKRHAEAADDLDRAVREMLGK